MTFNIQETYDKNMAELQELVKQINDLDSRIIEFKEQAEAQLRQMSEQRQQTFVVAKQKEALVLELQPYVKQKDEEEADETKVETPEVAVKETKKTKNRQ